MFFSQIRGREAARDALKAYQKLGLALVRRAYELDADDHERIPLRTQALAAGASQGSDAAQAWIVGDVAYAAFDEFEFDAFFEETPTLEALPSYARAEIARLDATGSQLSSARDVAVRALLKGSSIVLKLARSLVYLESSVP